MNELTHVMPEAEARRLTERIRIAAVNYTDAKDKLLHLVTQAKEGAAHEALGYASWTAYLSEVLGDEPLRLARDERKEVVSLLSGEQMPNTVIASTLGVGEATVRRDLQSISSFDEIDQPRTVTKTDGKQYTIQPRPEPNVWIEPETPAEPPKPKRRPITDQAHDAGWEIRKATEKLQRIFEDDRLGRNKEEVAAHVRGHLKFTVETCQGLLDQINQ